MLGLSWVRSLVGGYEWFGIGYGHRGWVITSISGLDSQDAPHTVDNESYQTSPELKINCLKVTDSCMVRLIFRYDPVVRFSKFLCQPKIQELYFHLSYLRAESVSGARRTSWIFCIAEVYLPYQYSQLAYPELARISERNWDGRKWTCQYLSK